MTTLFDATETSTDAGDRQPGRVARVIGPVVDIEFGRNSLPALYNALTVEIELGEALAKQLGVRLEVGWVIFPFQAGRVDCVNCGAAISWRRLQRIRSPAAISCARSPK